LTSTITLTLAAGTVNWNTPKVPEPESFTTALLARVWPGAKFRLLALGGARSPG
jgi:hypothetical protein